MDAYFLSRWCQPDSFSILTAKPAEQPPFSAQFSSSVMLCITASLREIYFLSTLPTFNPGAIPPRTFAPNICHHAPVEGWILRAGASRINPCAISWSLRTDINARRPPIEWPYNIYFTIVKFLLRIYKTRTFYLTFFYWKYCQKIPQKFYDLQISVPTFGVYLFTPFFTANFLHRFFYTNFLSCFLPIFFFQ